MSNKSFHRRAFLRTSSAVIGLPLLESLSPRMASAAVQIKVANPTAKRTVCIGNSFGMYQPHFFPKEAGADYAVTPLLQPIERHRRDFTVFSNLDHGVKGGHFAVHSFLSGLKSSDAKGRPDGNITLDQRIAEVVGAQTRFPSLTVGSRDGLHGGCMMSWTRTGVRVPPISGPRALFRKLFVNDSAEGKTKAADRFRLKGSILDAIAGDATGIEKRLSGRDRDKLDEYFSSVRDVERRIQQQEKWYAIDKPAPTVAEPSDDGLVDDIPELYELIAIALETDATRIASFEMAGADFRTALFGLKQGYHGLSHHGKVQANIDGLVKIETYQMEQFGKFLDRWILTGEAPLHEFGGDPSNAAKLLVGIRLAIGGWLMIRHSLAAPRLEPFSFLRPCFNRRCNFKVTRSPFGRCHVDLRSEALRETVRFHRPP